jgi:septal ring factor EnvC (AmiA/AmiB activator)
VDTSTPVRHEDVVQMRAVILQMADVQARSKEQEKRSQEQAAQIKELVKAQKKSDRDTAKLIKDNADLVQQLKDTKDIVKELQTQLLSQMAILIKRSEEPRPGRHDPIAQDDEEDAMDTGTTLATPRSPSAVGIKRYFGATGDTGTSGGRAGSTL